MWRSLVFLCMLTPTSSFLIEGSTSKPDGTFLTDVHYNALIDLFIQERQSRQNLEKFVVQLNQRLTIIEQDNVNLKAKIETLEKANVSEENQYEALLNETKAVKQNYDSLLRQHSDLQHESDEMKKEILGLKQSKTISFQDLEAEANKTVHLQNEIQNMNNNVNLLLSDGNARKQDFLALVQVTKATKSDLLNVQSQLSTKLENFVNFTTSSINILETNIDSKIQNLEAVSNNTIEKLSESTETVTLTAFADGSQTANDGEVIKFSRKILSNGIHNTTTFKQTGYFTCERKGLYAVFASIVTSSQDAKFLIYKNSNPVTIIFVSSSQNTIYESGSGMGTFQLNVGDKIRLTAWHNNIRVHDFSSVSFFKIN